MRFLHARSIAAVNSLGSGNVSKLGRFICSAAAEDETVEVRAAFGGGAFEDHFHPGALVFSSRRERRRSDDGAKESSRDGSRRSVMENPGIFKLVCGMGQITN
jgi:hypothetical protein